MKKHADLFTPRQLVALTTFSDLVSEVRERVLTDAVTAGLLNDGMPLSEGGMGATGYADAVATYLGLALSRFTDFSNAICSWDSGNTNLRQLFARQAIPMAWDYVETNPLTGVVNIESAIQWAASALRGLALCSKGHAKQLDATSGVNGITNPVIFTDPPYYDNIGYADLADFFYVWLRRSLGKLYPNLFSTLLTPKSQELVATPYRFGEDREKARQFFEEGLERAFVRMREAQHPDYPLTVYYAFKQAEQDIENNGDNSGAMAFTSTGWETMLEGLLKASFTITGTWPMRTEQQQRSRSIGSNALASSIVLVCRPRPGDAPLATRGEVVAALKRELPDALKKLQHGNIAPVDLAQAAIGPGIAIFSRYAKVLEANGTIMRVRTALALINRVLDEMLAEQEGEFDADTRWSIAWFEQHGFEEGPFGVAETLSKAKNTAVSGLVESGILVARAGKVRLLRRSELTDHWAPMRDRRVTAWEVTQHLIQTLEQQGETGAAALVQNVGGLGEVARDLAYRLYGICERKKWAQEALAYNSLVIAWPEITRLAGQGSSPMQEGLF